MKFIYKGKIENWNDIPKFELPINAVKYREPDTMEELIKAVLPWHIPLILLIILGIFIRFLLYSQESILPNLIELLPTIAGLFLILPLFFLHEFIHALCFPKGAKVYCYTRLAQGVLMVTSDEKLNKYRFIYISIMPLLVLGVLPFLIWVFYPESTYLTRTLMTFSPILILVSCGDLMNIYHTIKQVPNNAKVAMSGMNTYWFIPEDN